MNPVVAEVRGGWALVTLNRPQALNALSLDMVRHLTQALLQWRDDPSITGVALRGMGRDGPFGALCAGGDIRFFHQAALAGDPRLEDFFTEEYTLNHLIHHYPKPYVALMDGIVMGGGMGIAGHGAARAWRVATERTRMAMPETLIGLFPDVGGGWFLARCPGHLGEYLALTGQVLGGADALDAGLADEVVDSASLPAWWDRLARGEGLPIPRPAGGGSEGGPSAADRPLSPLAQARGGIDRHFSGDTVRAIVASLEGAAAEGDAWAQTTAQTLRQRSPLMLHVALAQVRRARSMTLADALRMERDLVRHCFHTDHLGRRGLRSETVEGIRALAIDKDHAPRWEPSDIEAVTEAMVDPFFDSPWPSGAHPLRYLG